MRGHLRKRGDRSWSVVVDIGHDPGTGKRRQKWIAVHGAKRDAEKRLAEVIRDLDAATFVEPSRLSLSGYLDQWMQDYVATSVRPRTARGYGAIVRRLQGSLGNVRLTELNPQHVQRYYSGLLSEGLSAQTILHHHRVLSQTIGQAVRWDMLSRNVLDRVTPPKRTKPELRTLTASEVQHLLRSTEGTEFHVAIHLAIHTGLRRSELCGLIWSDVDLGARSLRVVRTMVSLRGDAAHQDEPKSRRSRRMVAFGIETAELLEERRASLSASGSVESARVCARRDGHEMLPDAVSRGFKEIAERCGITGARFNDRRHTHASLLLASGVPVHVVQARMGHESIQTTVDIYGHVLPASDVEAGQVLERHLAG